jgi:hypothetical protein
MCIETYIRQEAVVEAAVEVGFLMLCKGRKYLGNQY